MAQVKLKFTGSMYGRMKKFGMDFAFEGNRVHDLINALLAQYNLRDLVFDAKGQMVPYTRIVVNGKFSELLGGLDAPLRDGDTIVLMHPYAVAF